MNKRRLSRNVDGGRLLWSILSFSFSFLVLKQSYISDIASSAVRSETDLRAVLAIPLHFQQNSRQTVMRSAEEAGFEVLQVISEPSAAVLAYGVGLSNLDEEQ